MHASDEFCIEGSGDVKGLPNAAFRNKKIDELRNGKTRRAKTY